REVFSLVRDSSGTVPAKGDQVVLLFSDSGQMFLYAASATEALGAPGTYSFANGKLTLQINTSEFHINKTFTLPAGATQVTMPFQVFSTKAGTSVWDEKPLDLVSGTFAVYNAAYSSEVGSPTAQSAGAAAQAYAQAWMSGSGPGAHASAPEVGSRGPGVLAGTPSVCDASGNNCVEDVVPLGTDIVVLLIQRPP